MKSEYTKSKEQDSSDANRDPITGAAGAHPISTGLGAVAGSIAAGAAIGTIAGPVGTAIGAVAGAVMGGLTGKAAGEFIAPTVDDPYWSKHYTGEAYYEKGYNYDDYAPAYRVGYAARKQYAGRPFEEVERDIERTYNSSKGVSRLSWDKAKAATRAAWDRI